jgi:hypothetical protein
MVELVGLGLVVGFFADLVIGGNLSPSMLGRSL